MNSEILKIKNEEYFETGIFFCMYFYFYIYFFVPRGFLLSF